MAATLPEAIRTYPSLNGAGALVAASFDLKSPDNSAFLIDASTGDYTVVDDGNMLAVHAAVKQYDTNNGADAQHPLSRYDFKLKMLTGTAPNMMPDNSVTLLSGAMFGAVPVSILSLKS